jgi:minor extracellular serine protease Vpr
MKRALLTLICFLSSLSLLSAQASLSSAAKLVWYELQHIALGKKNPNTEQQKQFDLDFRNGQWRTGAVLFIHPELFSASRLTEAGVVIQSKIGNLVTVRVPLEQFSTLASDPGIVHIDMGEVNGPELHLSLPDTRTDSVHAGASPLSRAYTGKGVIVAVIDWGFDFNHPVFYDSTLSEYRISRVWDQLKTQGPAPSGFDYGTEIVGQTALMEAKEDTQFYFGPFSHGTHVANIAAGTGAGTQYKGVAFESELVFVQLMRSASAYIDAIHWIEQYAASVNKPFVVNMSFGGHRGPHDGTDAQNQAIDLMAGPGKIFVGSAGNNGNGNFHLHRNFSDNNDTLLTVVNFANHIAESFGQTLSMWGSANSDFQAAIRFVDGSNNTLLETTWFSASMDTVFFDTLMIGNDSIIFRFASIGSSPLNNKPNISWEVRNPGNYKMILRIHSNQSEVHLWNNVRMGNRYTNWGVNLGNNYPGATEGNTQYGMGEPAGCGRNVVTTASHRASIILPSGQMGFGNISGYSSRGPTVDGRTKPDISGPGENVISAVNSNDTQHSNESIFVSFNGQNYPFAQYSGTSMSGPAVAGIAALMLQANRWLSQTEIRDIIRNTARLDSRTGNIGPNGSLTWGWGKVNALAALLAVEQYAGIAEMNPDDVTVFPNPSQKEIKINGLTGTLSCKLYDLTGKLVLNTQSNAESPIALPSLPSGTYLLEIHGNNRAIFKKIAIQP